MQKAKKEKTDIYQVTNRRKQKRRDEDWEEEKGTNIQISALKR